MKVTFADDKPPQDGGIVITNLTRGFLGFGLFLSAACATTPAPTVEPRVLLNDVSLALRASPLLLPEDVPEGRRCSISSSMPPSPATIVDVDGYRASLDGALDGPVAGDVLLSVGADSTGALTWFRILRTSLQDSLATVLANTLQGHLRPIGDGVHTAGWRYRLQITPSAADGFIRVGQSVHCGARMRNEAEVRQRMEDRAAWRPDFATLNEHDRTVTLRLRIGRDGRILAVRIGKSSGYAGVDHIARDAYSVAVFDPSLLDGESVEEWRNWPVLVPPMRRAHP